MDPIRSLTLGDIAREHRRSWPHHTAVVDGGVRLTYRELDDRVNRLANAFVADGVGPGDRVLWLGQNSFRIMECLLACAKTGAVFCPVNWRQTPEELAFVIDDCAPAIVIWQELEVGEAIRAGRALARPTSARWLRHDTESAAESSTASYEAFLAAGSTDDAELEVSAELPVLQIYTAAFSGRPNGAQLSHLAIIGQDLVIAMAQQITPHYRYLCSGPLFHIGCFMFTLATFHMAGTNVFVRRVVADELCEVIERERCTGAYILGPTVDQMVEANRDGRYDLSSLRILGGPPEWVAMTSPDESPWGRRPGGFGQTEVMGMTTFTAFDAPAPGEVGTSGEPATAGATDPGAPPIGTHGRPGPVTSIRILDEDGHELAPGEVGEIAVRGLTVMTGYWDRPEENARRTRDGWYRTNDLGRREADGSISFIGPKGRMLKSAAENIYPAEVEGCLRSHPAVADVAIIGVPDERWTQSVKAIVVLEAGHAHTTADELIEHCRARIASYKKPRTVEFVDALPRNGFLVDYDALDARFGGGAYPGGTNRSA
jgi:acyl-CoA synthetase (AMP-forming)/AMP-acid ligase II